MEEWGGERARRHRKKRQAEVHGAGEARSSLRGGERVRGGEEGYQEDMEPRSVDGEGGLVVHSGEDAEDSAVQLQQHEIGESWAWDGATHDHSNNIEPWDQQQQHLLKIDPLTNTGDNNTTFPTQQMTGGSESMTPPQQQIQQPLLVCNTVQQQPLDSTNAAFLPTAPMLQQQQQQPQIGEVSYVSPNMMVPPWTLQQIQQQQQQYPSMQGIQMFPVQASGMYMQMAPGFHQVPQMPGPSNAIQNSGIVQMNPHNGLTSYIYPNMNMATTYSVPMMANPVAMPGYYHHHAHLVHQPLQQQQQQQQQGNVPNVGSSSSSHHNDAANVGDGNSNLGIGTNTQPTKTDNNNNHANYPRGHPIRSDFRGVSWHKHDKKWIGRAWIPSEHLGVSKGKTIYVGAFRDPIIAAIAVDEKCLQFSDKLPLNFPDTQSRYETLRTKLIQSDRNQAADRRRFEKSFPDHPVLNL